MSGFFMGRDAKLMTEDRECPDIRVWHMDLEEAEFGHMGCRIEESIQLLYVLRGSMTCQINQEKKDLRTGEGLFINKKQAYRFLGSGSSGCEFYLFQMQPEYAGDGEEGTLTLKYIRPLIRSAEFFSLKLLRGSVLTEEIMECLRRGGETAKSRRTCYELELKSLMLKAWAALYQEFDKNATMHKKAAGRETEKLCVMLDYLHGHYKEKITLGQMAGNSNVSSGDYCRFFKKHMHQTPFEYLQAYRVEQSIPELLEKSGSITEVALRHGFTGSSYYAEIFKKEMGCAPGDYRKWYLRESRGDCPLRKKTDKMQVQAGTAVKRRESMPAHLL